MLADMDADDWQEWPEFAELMPFGAVQEALYHGTTASLLYNANRGENARVLEPADFFPHLQRLTVKREQSPKRARLLMALQNWKARGLKLGLPLPKGTALGTQPPELKG